MLRRFFRSLWSRHEDRRALGRSNVPRPLVELEGISHGPPDLLRRLRLIDPLLDLYNVGEGNWWLMRLNDNRRRRHVAGNILGKTLIHEKNRWIRLQAKLAYRGMGLIKDFYGPPDGRVVNYFLMQDWKERTGTLEAEFEHSLLVSDGTVRADQQLAVMRAKLDADGRSIHRYAFRRPVSSSGSHLRRTGT